MTKPVLLLTSDDAFYRHWNGLGANSWAPVRGASLADLAAWSRRGQAVLMDARLLARLDTLEPGSIAPGLKIVVASASPNDPEAQRALVAGAVGYVHAFMPVSGLSQVLEHVLQGNIWLGQDMLARLLSQLARARAPGAQQWDGDLTAREREVAHYVALGHSNLSIATSLGISERTVRAHVSAVFEKLAVSDRLALALKVHGIEHHAL